jgi:hypothetical protein
VGLRLGAAIFFMPWAFAWFTLRKGYSDRAKQVAFGWATVLVLFVAWPKYGAHRTVTSPVTVAGPSNEETAGGPAMANAVKEALTRILTTELESVTAALDETDAAIKAKKWPNAETKLSSLADLFEPLRGVQIAINGTDKKTGKTVPGATELVEYMRSRYESYRSAVSTFEDNDPQTTRNRRREAAQDEVNGRMTRTGTAERQLGEEPTEGPCERAVEVIKNRCGPLVRRYPVDSNCHPSKSDGRRVFAG